MIILPFIVSVLLPRCAIVKERGIHCCNARRDLSTSRSLSSPSGSRLCSMPAAQMLRRASRRAARRGRDRFQAWYPRTPDISTVGAKLGLRGGRPASPLLTARRSGGSVVCSCRTFEFEFLSGWLWSSHRETAAGVGQPQRTKPCPR